MKYADEIKRAMEFLGEQPDTLFLGQCVGCPGNRIHKVLVDVPAAKRLELPVFEEVQLGMSTGLALEGIVPISVFPRFNFLLLAMNQLVNHLDKIAEISRGGWQPKVIIRTVIGSVRPQHPGVQHCGDFTESFRALGLKNVDVVRLDEPEQVFPAFEHAYRRTDGKSTILVEWGDHYTEK